MLVVLVMVVVVFLTASGVVSTVGGFLAGVHGVVGTVGGFFVGVHGVARMKGLKILKQNI